MEPADVIDEVNELLRLGVGDAFRLEHIKQAYIHEKTVWDSDKKYLEDLRAKYLSQIRPENEDLDKIHCWKCGRKNPLGGNYCMMCGAALFEVGKDAPEPGEHEPDAGPPAPKPAPEGARKGRLKWVVLALAVAGAASVAAAALFYGGFDAYVQSGPPALSVLPDSRCDPGMAFEEGSCRVSTCGTGTVFDGPTRSCVVPPCGAGLAYDPALGSCVVPP